MLTFENGDIRVVAPLDSLEGRRYVEPVREEYDSLDLENIYNIFLRIDDYVKPTANGTLSWRSISSCSSYFDEALENWQNMLHEVSMRRCVSILKSICWIGKEVCDRPTCEGLPNLDAFITYFEVNVPEKQ